MKSVPNFYEDTYTAMAPQMPSIFPNGQVYPAQADRSWKLIESELIEVEYDGKMEYLLKKDLNGLLNMQKPEGVLILPSHDPYLQMRDRSTLIADVSLRKKIWKPAGSPGIVIVDGEIMATWQKRKKGKTMSIKVEFFNGLDERSLSKISKEFTSMPLFKDGINIKLDPIHL
jgi:hypothetical protein